MFCLNTILPKLKKYDSKIIFPRSWSLLMQQIELRLFANLTFGLLMLGVMVLNKT
jgi:hypothetical protein